MKLRKKLLLIFLVFLVLITLVIIISKDNKEDKNVVRFGYAYNIGQLPGVIGVEKGFFSQQGLEINSLILEGGKDITEAMLAGEIDFGLASSGGIIPAAVISDDIKIVATTSWGGGRKRLMIRKDLKIDNFPELINKKIAVRIGGTQYKNLLKLIDKSDLTKDDFKILNMKNSDAMVVLQIGDIDAYLCGEPDCAIIEYKGIGYELLNFDKTEIDPNFLMVRKQFMEENPDLVVRFLKGWINSQKFIDNNFKEAKEILSDKGEIEIEIVNIATKYMRNDIELSDFVINAIKEDAEFLLVRGEIEKLPNFDELIIKKYLEEAKNDKS